MFDLLFGLHHLKTDARGERPWTVVRPGPWCVRGFTRISLLLPWQAQPLRLGIGYHTGDEARISCEYELPQRFVQRWPTPSGGARGWRLSCWDPVTKIEEDLARRKLSLRVLADHPGASVLILGRDTGRALTALRRIAQVLRTLGYFGVLLRDVPHSEFLKHSLEEKLLALASVCDFAIVEDSGAGGPYRRDQSVDARQKGRRYIAWLRKI
jgi:hypothetical protein